MSKHIKFFEDEDIQCEKNDMYLDYKIDKDGNRVLKQIDGKYIKIDKHNPLYKKENNYIYSFGYNSTIIHTGEYYRLIGINIDNKDDNIQKLQKMDRISNGLKTLNTTTISVGVHFYFMVTDDHIPNLKDVTSINIEVLGISMDIKYNGQFLCGPTVIYNDGKTYSCKVNEGSVKYGISILPDVIYNEILNYKAKIKNSNIFNNLIGSNPNTDYENLDDTNIDSMILSVQMIIGFLQSMKNKRPRRRNTQRIKKVSDKIKKEIELKNSVQRYIFDRLDLNDNGDGIINGVNLAEKYIEWSDNNDSTLTYSKIYDAFVKCHIKPTHKQRIKYFVGVAFKDKKDYIQKKK